MSKYILKKDLPFAKAGRELAEFCDIIVCWETKGVLNNPPGVEATAHYIGKVKDLNRLIAEGWMEEVKEIPHEQKCEEGISILEIIRNAVHHARMNRRIVDKAYLSPRLYRSFRDELQTEFDCFPPTKSGDKFEGVYVERKNDEPYISFTYKEPESDKKPREFIIILDSDGKATAISRPGAKAWDYFPSDKKAIWVKETIKVREVME